MVWSLTRCYHELIGRLVDTVEKSSICCGSSDARDADVAFPSAEVVHPMLRSLIEPLVRGIDCAHGA